MDNLSSHKVPGIKEKIETAGATLLYLPPYSPNLNPIEKAWSKLKHILRKAKARSEELLDQATGEALKLITPEDARGWFRLCATDLSYLAECSIAFSALLGTPDGACSGVVIGESAHRGRGVALHLH